jgi:hypothetical protein
VKISFFAGVAFSVLFGFAAHADQPAMPQDEQSFVALMAKYSAANGQAQNDMQRGGLRNQRATAVCSLLGGGEIKNWVGTISTLDSTSDGRGVFGVQINSNLTIETENNAFSDSVLPLSSLIPANSPLFNEVSNMKVGDTVIFSGMFVPNSQDCFYEDSLTTDGSLTSPDYIFAFDDVKDVGSSQ